jgi:hypothetical protein
MKLMAHVGEDGRIQGLVVMQDTGTVGMLVPQAGIQVCEIEDHGLKDDALESGALEKFMREHSVEVSAARGKVTKRTQGAD